MHTSHVVNELEASLVHVIAKESSSVSLTSTKLSKENKKGSEKYPKCH